MREDQRRGWGRSGGKEDSAGTREREGMEEGRRRRSEGEGRTGGE